MGENTKFVLIFIDGLGLALPNVHNPLVYSSMPTLQNLIGGQLIDSVSKFDQNVVCKGIDATLGVSGVPQSATGQTALFTGINAASHLGYHLPAFPNEELVSLIQRHSILKQVTDLGLTACFANAYRPEYFQVKNDSYSVTTHCVLAASLSFLFVNDLLAHRAVYWDITNDNLHHNYDKSIPIISPYSAGKNLAHVASDHHLTIFESFESDLIGHKKDMEKAILFLEKLDSFLLGVFDHVLDGTTVILTSDHGNIEQLNSGAHTRNRVPLLVVGKQSNDFVDVQSIKDVVPAMLSAFK